MKSVLLRASLILLFGGYVFAQQSERKHIPITMADILRKQAAGVSDKSGFDLNERIRTMVGTARFSQNYLLGPGDIITVNVFGIRDLTEKELTLDSEGRISLPFINDLSLMGLTPRESEIKIGALFEASVMKNPQVTVSVKEYRSQFINVLGAVYKPGTYQLTRRAFLVDALAMAGGLLLEKAELKCYVHREAPNQPISAETEESDEKTETKEIDLVQLLEKGDVSLNIPIYAGDVISVPERIERFFYVLGDVVKGGAFEIKRGEKITLSKALASAGGLSPTAKAGSAAVIRQDPDGNARQIPINAAKVLKGEVEDIELAQNDVVFIPGSTSKTIGRALINSIGSVVASLVYLGGHY
jgi:polysaccharide biosynthesis/export protein